MKNLKNPMKFTILHGKKYDLTHFQHPGGETPIWQAYGRDATTMFESYHPFVSKEKLNAILKKYYVGEEGKKEESDIVGTVVASTFVYDTEFSRDLISSVRSYFEELSERKNITLSQAVKPTWDRTVLLIGLFCIFRSSFDLYFGFTNFFMRGVRFV